MSELGKIFTRNGADKASKHRYDRVYQPILEPIREDPINLLEIGVFRGHGMASFAEYLPNASLYGVDLFQRLRPEQIPALNHPRVKWAKVDSTTPAVTSALHKFGVEFDVIIDDGAHWPEANMLTFRRCSPFLKSGGVYIIEDVWPLERMSSEQLNHWWLKRYKERYDLMKNEAFLTELKNSGMKIERFDHRHITGEPDSYIITLRKS